MKFALNQRFRVLVITLSFYAVAMTAKEMPSREGDGPVQMMLFDFSENTEGWKKRTYTNQNVPILEELAVATAQQALRLPVQLPGKNEFTVPVGKNWKGWDFLVMEVVLPPEMPTDVDFIVFTKDWDHLWRQVRMSLPAERGSSVQLRVAISGNAATRVWETCGHERPWHPLTSAQLLEVGCMIESKPGTLSEFKGSVELHRVWLEKGQIPSGKPLTSNFFCNPEQQVGNVLEFGFEYHAAYEDVFDQDQVNVTAEIADPAGNVEEIQGFYYEDFLYDATASTETELLVPHGFPQFRFRYLPKLAGEYRICIRVQLKDQEHEDFSPITVAVEPAADNFHGFVKVDDEDKRFFAYEDGSPFWGIGMNVRSPFDTRYIATVPFSNWRDENLGLYKRLFPKYKRNGINVVEVWMSSWWLALEWINDRPGFHGVGHMNQYRAWMLDRILNWAEEQDIYLILVFNNHGKFGALNDTEWDRNPFNKKNGGYLESCEEYFSDARAKADFKKFCDYTIARWAYSPNILMWKLFTEIDLTGESYDFYKDPVMAAWHGEMTQYVKKKDPYKHPMTTHWMLSYQKINDAVADLPELDVLTTDAYYQQGGTAQLVNLLQGTAKFAEAKNKPVLVTEFGGSPHADNMGNLIKQAHIGIWTGFFCGSSVAPFFWWFALVDEQDLYGRYASLAEFSTAENRRGMKGSFRDLAEASIRVNELRSDERILVWGYDTEYYFSDAENLQAKQYENLELEILKLQPGTYDVEYWNVEAGKVLKCESVMCEDAGEKLVLQIPGFRKDFALKIVLKKSAP